MKIHNLFDKFFGHSLTRSSAIVFGGSMVANVSSYLYHLIVGRILGPIQYGELTAIFSLFFVLNVPAQVLQTVLVRYFSILYARKEVGQARELFWIATRLIAIWGTIAGAVFLLITPFLSQFLHIQSYWYFLWLVCIFIFFILSIINASALQGFQKFGAATGFGAASVVLRIIFGVPLAFFGVSWALFGNLMSNIASYIIYFYPIRFLINSKPSKLTISKKMALSYSFPALLATLGMTGLYTFDILFVKHYFSPLSAGLYSAITVVGKIIFFGTSAVGYVLFPVISARKEQKQDFGHLILFAAAVVSSISLGMVAVYFLFPNFILSTLFGSAYNGATGYLGYYGIFIALVAIDTLLVTTYLALGSTYVWMTTIGAFVMQMVLMAFFHGTLIEVLFINIGSAAGLLLALLLYYPYAKRHT